MDNRIKYAQEASKGCQDLENIFEQSVIEVLNDLGVPMEEYQDCYDEVCVKEPNFSKYVIAMCNNLKLEIHKDTKKKITKENVINYFQVQMEEISKGSLDAFKDLEPQQAIFCTKTFLGDFASKKVGIEEEEIGLLPQLLNDPDVIKKQNELAQMIPIPK